MADKIVNGRIQHKHDVETNWGKAENFAPKDGELIIYDPDDTHAYPRIKIGYNETNVNDLPFVVGDNHSHGIENVDGLQTQLDTINTKLAELMYEPITISSFTNNVGTVELGNTVTSVTLNWATSKTPTTLTLAGTEMDANLKTHTYSGLSLTATKSYKLVVTDEKGAKAEKTSYVYFYNRVCYGVAAQPDAVDSAFVMSLPTKTLSGSKTNNKIAYSAGEGQYLWYCVPVRLGTCSFTDIETGLGAGLSLVATIKVTNASNFEEDYYVYRSDYAGLGSVNVKVT